MKKSVTGLPENFLRQKNWAALSGKIDGNNVKTEENTEKSQSCREESRLIRAFLSSSHNMELDYVNKISDNQQGLQDV